MAQTIYNAVEQLAADKAHAAVYAADARFTAALERRYRGAAGDMRYRTSELPADIKVLAVGYQAAVEEWRATWRVSC